MAEKIIRITTVPVSLEKLLEGQLTFINNTYEVTAVSAEKERLTKYGKNNGVKTFHVARLKQRWSYDNIDIEIDLKISK